MRPKALAATLCLAFGMTLTLGAMSTGLEGCSVFEKKAKTVADDIKGCFGPDVKGDIGDLVKGIGTALICDIASGGNALPACTIEGLQTIAEEIGPSGKADVQCVVQKLAQDAAGEKVGASPDEALRTKRAKLLVKAGTLALRSPGDSTPRTGPGAWFPLADASGLNKEKAMHYKNGREAKNGDKVVMVQSGRMYVGVLYDAQAGNDHCNGNLAPLAQTTYANLAECLHMDDAVAALPASVPDSSKPSAPDATPSAAA